MDQRHRVCRIPDAPDGSSTSPTPQYEGHRPKENSCQPNPTVIPCKQSWTQRLSQLSTAPRRISSEQANQPLGSKGRRDRCFRPFWPGFRRSFRREIGLANDAAVVFVLAANEIAEFCTADAARIEPLENEPRFQVGGADRCRQHGGEPRLRFIGCFARRKYPEPDLEVHAWKARLCDCRHVGK